MGKFLVKDFSFEFKDGLYIIRGAEGSGKTTLSLILSGGLRPDYGNVKILGKNLYRRSDDKFLKKAVGTFFPVPLVIPYISVLDNVMLFSGSRKGVTRKGERHKAFNLLESVELFSMRKMLANELSLGQMQRVALCRTLFTNPQILIADEPTSNIDTYSASILEQRILDFSNKKRRLVIVTTNYECCNFLDVPENRYISLSRQSRFEMCEIDN
ncbi:MAG: ATP-binding cassette domain-containing protein [Spirochaetales bacterium]|nr:ATP-binding cassette domain-containing protein [Spirochaetales bacterium]